MCLPGQGRQTACSPGSLSEGATPYSSWHTMQVLSSGISSFATLGSWVRNFWVRNLSVMVNFFSKLYQVSNSNSRRKFVSASV